MSTLLDSTSRPASADVTRSATDRETLRVCHVSLTLCTGGLERLLADFARHENGPRFDLSFLAMRERGRFADEIEQHGKPVHVLSAERLLSQVREMAAFFRRHKIDIVHTHNTYPHIYGTLAARLAGVSVVVNTKHGQRFGMGWRSRVKYRLASKACDRIIAVSEDAKRLAHEQDHIPESKVIRIWNGIDLTNFRYHGPAHGLHAISVARLSAEKDYATLLHAWQHIHRVRPETTLTLVGDGPERVYLERLSDDLGLKHVVSFLGMRTDVPDLLSRASFFVSSSKSEGISLTLLEAMAAGLPIVATAVGGNPEIIDPDRTGKLVPSENPEAFANAVLELAEVRDTWDRIGQAARERVETHFSIERMLTDYRALYEELLTRKRR